MSERKTPEEIYLAYKDKVAAYVRGKIPNAADAEDIVSKVFLKVMEKYDTYDESKAAVSTWIYTITGNTVIDFYRTQKVHGELEETFSYTEDGYDEIIKEETLEELANALEKLDQRSRDVIILHYYSGHTLKEVAGMMNMSYANMKLVHAKAIRLLGDYMKN